MAVAGSIVLLTFAVYLPTLFTGYMSDDFDVLVVRELPWAAAFEAFPAGTGYYFRPLPLLTYRLEAALGIGPLGSHLANVVLHAATALLVVLVARRLGARRLLAASLAVWFAVHTANATPVSWISARGDLLVAFFALLAVLVWVSAGRKRPTLDAAALAVLVVLALLSKEAAAGLPIVLVLLSVALRARGVARPWWPLVVTALPWAIWLTWTGSRVQEATGGPGTSCRRPSSCSSTSRKRRTARWSHSAVRRSRLCTWRGRRSRWWLPRSVVSWLRSRSCWWRVGRRPRRGVRLLALDSGLSFRMLYLPLAVLASTVVLVPMRAAGQRRLAAGVLVAALVMSWATLDAARTWARNAELVRVGCTTWLELVPDPAWDPPVIVVSAPNRAGGLPVFSNDLTAALHHCATGSFGRFANVTQLMATELGARDPVVGVSELVFAEGRWSATWTAPSRSAWVRAWDPWPDGVRAHVDAVRADGRVAGVSLGIEGVALQSHVFLDFDATGFRRIATAQPSEGE
jgi:hypothetical protein